MTRNYFALTFAKKISTLSVLIISLMVQLSYAQSVPKNYYTFPIKPGQQNYLSGTMGELRPNHFHAGLDIKTGGREGLPIHCIADGYVNRIKVSPYGYGLALYVLHPNGQTSVYAHISKFEPGIADFVLKAQYKNESFAVELFPTVNQFKFKQGDIIAYSGNTGSSQGPHLHFEIRDASQFPLNPLMAGFSEVKDNIHPIVNSVGFMTLSKDGRIQGNFGSFEMKPIKVANGNYKLQPIEAYGNIGLSVNANDLLNGANNRNGIAGLEVLVDGVKTFRYYNDRFSFATQRMMNAHMEFSKYADGKGRFHRCYQGDGNRLNMYSPDKNKGHIIIRDNKEHDVKVEMWDAYNNRTTLSFVLVGKKDLEERNVTNIKKDGLVDISETGNFLRINTTSNLMVNKCLVYHNLRKTHLDPDYFFNGKPVFLWDLREGLPDSIFVNGKRKKLDYQQQILPRKSFTYYSEKLNVYFPKASLFDTLYFAASVNGDSIKVGTPTTPLNQKITITVKADQVKEKTKAAVYRLEGKKKQWEGGTWKGNQITFTTKNPGQFVILEDHKAPTTKFIGSQDNKLRLQIKDDLSTIGGYRATLDGKWILMHYDVIDGYIWTERKDKTAPLKGKFELSVWDEQGNKSFYSRTL